MALLGSLASIAVPMAIKGLAPAFSAMAHGRKPKMSLKTPEEVAHSFDGLGFKFGGLKGGMKSFGKKALNNPFTQGLMFNAGADLSGRMMHGLLDKPDQDTSGQGIRRRKRKCCKSRKNLMLSHGLGVAPPIPFGGMIDRSRPVLSIGNRPTMNIATRGVAPSTSAAIHQPSAPMPATSISTARPTHITKPPITFPTRKAIKPNLPLVPKLPNQSAVNTVHSVLPSMNKAIPKALPGPRNMMRPPLASRPSNIIPKIKQGVSKVKRLGKKTLNLGKRGVAKLSKSIKRLKRTAPGTLKQIAHPKQFSRKIARKAALKSQNLLHKVRPSKIKNKHIRRGVRKIKVGAQRVINAVDRYGQRGNMGSRPYNISKKLSKIGQQAKKASHAGRSFIRTAKRKVVGSGMPYLPGPLA